MSYKDEVQLIQQPDLSEPEVPPKDKKFKGYYKISRHYNWALNTTFKYGYDFVIIVEGNFRISPSLFHVILIETHLQTISISRQTFTNTSWEHSHCCE
jgi:alpha-1,3-mannosyl-glycoprotein beta-1,2-N-acetylglucosaminyltransferase